MRIYFGRKKEINAMTTVAPSRMIQVKAYPIILHFQFPFKLAIYRDPCRKGQWTVCEYSTGVHLIGTGRTRKETIKSVIERAKVSIKASKRTPKEIINELEVINK